MTPDARARLGDAMHRLSGEVPIISEDVCACGDCVVFAVWVQKEDAERFLNRLESTAGAPAGAIDWGWLKS